MKRDIGEVVKAIRPAYPCSSVPIMKCFMTATYWEIGLRIVEFEQGSKKKAEYGDELLKRLGTDLSERFGRGFSKQNLERMRRFYLKLGTDWIASTLSRQLLKHSGSDPVVSLSSAFFSAHAV